MTAVVVAFWGLGCVYVNSNSSSALSSWLYERFRKQACFLLVFIIYHLLLLVSVDPRVVGTRQADAACDGASALGLNRGCFIEGYQSNRLFTTHTSTRTRRPPSRFLHKKKTLGKRSSPFRSPFGAPFRAPTHSERRPTHS